MKRKNRLFLSVIVVLFFFQSVLDNLYFYNYLHLANTEPFSTAIPDKIFPCAKNSECHIRKQKVESVLNSSRVVIAATIRDRQEQITMIRKSVENVAAEFKESVILIVENDSEDNTRSELLAWAAENPSVVILGCGVNNSTCSMNFTKTDGHSHKHSRIYKMATIRNLYMDYIRNHYSNFDYLMVWDIDIEGTVFMEGLYSTFDQFQNLDNVDGICSYGLRPHFVLGWLYYDPFAHKEIAPDPSAVNHDIYIQLNLWWSLQRGMEMKPVKSCFGGMTTYRISSIMAKNTTYSYSSPEEPVVCEHVYFNEPLNMYLNPSHIYAVIKN